MLKTIATSCDDGSCPTIFTDTETGDVLVQGYLPDGSETRVRMSATAWRRLLSELPPQ
jgi:hypothetical protein